MRVVSKHRNKVYNLDNKKSYLVIKYFTPHDVAPSYANRDIHIFARQA